MSFRGYCKFAKAVPRLLWNSTVTVRPGTSTLVGRISVSTLDSIHPIYRSTALLPRRFSSGPGSTDVTYDQLKQLLADGRSVVIDVRDPWELREQGVMPGSINVPVEQLSTALQLGPEEFQEKYGGKMPQQTDHIVFTCLKGIRSKTALNTATSLGFKDVQHYPGGWQDWVEKKKKLIDPQSLEK